MSGAFPASKPIPEEFSRLLRYDPVTGEIVWLVDQGRGRAGRLAGCETDDGHRAIKYQGKTYGYHRVAWFLHTGEQPPKLIDHADGDGLNNSWGNLRGATHRQNSINRRPKERDLPVGVHRKKKRFAACIKIAGRFTHLGLFKTVAEAAEAYEKKAAEVHGEYRRAA